MHESKGHNTILRGKSTGAVLDPSGGPSAPGRRFNGERGADGGAKKPVRSYDKMDIPGWPFAPHAFKLGMRTAGRDYLGFPIFLLIVIT